MNHIRFIGLKNFPDWLYERKYILQRISLELAELERIAQLCAPRHPPHQFLSDAARTRSRQVI